MRNKIKIIKVDFNKKQFIPKIIDFYKMKKIFLLFIIFEFIISQEDFKKEGEEMGKNIDLCISDILHCYNFGTSQEEKFIDIKKNILNRLLFYQIQSIIKKHLGNYIKDFSKFESFVKFVIKIVHRTPNNNLITKTLRIEFIKYLTKYSSNNQNKPGMRRVKADPQSKNSLCELLMEIFGYDVSLCY